MKCTRRAVRSIGIIILLIAQVFQPFTAKAQSLSVVKGIVHGDNNLPLVNASVIIRNNKTNFTTGAKTDSAGVFTVQVPAGGPYEFKISNVGYEQQTLSGYNLKEGTMFQLDVPMKLTAGTLD
ncbi:MAG TPA: carboxypeptidase-like regulatory domain-containing protein, partial [Flavisolibacter sp.]